MELKSPAEKITRSIIDLQVPQPMFAHLLTAMRFSEIPKEFETQTMAVNAKGNCMYAPKFVEKISLPELKGVLLHEVLHVALTHIARIGHRDPKLSNIAQDIVVNNIVKRAGFTLPEDTINVDIHNDTCKLDIPGNPITIKKVSEKAWEEIYQEIWDRLPPEMKSKIGQGKGRGKGKGDGKGDEDRSKEWNPKQFDAHQHEDGTADENAKAGEEWKERLTDAATYAKQQGKLPNGMDRIIDKLLKPRIEWKQILLKFVREHVNPVDWSYRAPHKKSKQLGVFLPCVEKESCEIEVLVDTSGSIGGDELQEFLSEIVGMAQAMSYMKMTVTFADTEAYEEARYEIENGDIPRILAMKPKGGGGTDMEAGLDFVKDKNPNTPVCIVLTDGYTSFNKSAKDYPFEVIWVLTKHSVEPKSIPYGAVIKMD